jgi:two-component system alkaline phosphatase synthesis response regulator PhoP
LVEDDAGLRLLLAHRLSSEGYQVETAPDGESGLRQAMAGGFGLVVLDVMLPGRSGFDVCRTMRHDAVGTPILMLTARGEVSDRVAGLRLGADDYVTKPFEMAELLARIEACLRHRAEPPPSTTFTFGSVRVDIHRCEVRRDGRPVDLSAREYHLLEHLIRRRGETLERDEILDAVWGRDSCPAARTVDVHVAWLRRKLEDDPHVPRYILTVHRRGYRFVG